MASAASKRAAVTERPRSGDSAADAGLSPAGMAAWLCAIPCALAVLVAILVLGPPLGDLISNDPGTRYLPRFAPFVDPEPTEKGRFLLALSGPILLSLATVLVTRRRPSGPVLPLLALGAQVVTVAFLVACLAGQQAVMYGPTIRRMEGVSIHWTFFTPATLVVAALLAGAVLLATRRRDMRALAAGWFAESRRRRIAATATASAVTAAWLLHAVDSDHSIAAAAWDVRFHLGFTVDEAFAVLNGLTPLVDFSAQYGSLWPYLAALSMALFGETLTVFTLTMCAISAVALIAVYDVLRRASGSAIAALLLYLPFLATSMFRVRGTDLARETFGNYFGVMPLRYAGPYLLAWLTARHVERGGRRLPWALFAVAGVVLLNNVDFGIAALGASVAALVWTTVEPRRSSLLRLVAAVVLGLLLAFALVSLLTLLRAGELPRLERLTDYIRVFALGGFGMDTITGVLGFHLAMYVTYVAAIATATVRALNGAANRVLTGMLAWSGVFGLGAGSYFVGRSNPEALIACFSAWGLALALLAAVVVPQLAAQRGRAPSPAALAVLFGLGLAACSLAQTPLPWTQASRFDASLPPTADASASAADPRVPPGDAATRRFVASIADGRRFVLAPDAPVAILLTTGHRIAEAYGVENVSPYTGTESMLTEERVETTLDALQRAGGNTVIASANADSAVFAILARRGYRLLGASGDLTAYDPQRGLSDAAGHPWFEDTLTKWVDAERLRPPALRDAAAQP